MVTGTALPRELLEQAVRYRVLLDSGNATADDLSEIEVWCSADLRHRHAWDSLQQIFEGMGQLPVEALRSTLLRPEKFARRNTLRVLGLSLLLGGGATAVVGSLRSGLTETAIGEIRTVEMPGRLMQVTLDTRTVIRSLDSRRSLDLLDGRVLVRAQACVGSCHPCVVNCNGVRVEVANGIFSVRKVNNLARIVAIKGEVEIHSGGEESCVLRQGMTAMPGQGGWVTEPARLADGPDWRNGILMTEGTTLGALLAELDLYHWGWPSCAPELRSLPVAGTFALLDHARRCSCSRIVFRSGLSTRWFLTRIVPV
jgi:transmembrane sensor